MLSKEHAPESLFNFNELPIHQGLLVAVSGGSDSLALLYSLVESGIAGLSVATVDHGLRPEAAEEAKLVAGICDNLGVSHTTLRWTPDKRTSASAREARYELLVGHAKDIGASAIALGHTLDDQAETLIMRARRVTENGATRGLSGMAAISTYNDIKLVRPLLHHSRAELRTYLNNRQIDWIDDPSNQNLSSERIRIRKELSRSTKLPHKRDIARLAIASASTRSWINQQAATVIAEFVILDGTSLVLSGATESPTLVLQQVYSTVIQTMGRQSFSVPVGKLDKIIQCFKSEKSAGFAIGKTLISVKQGKARFEPERRNTTTQATIPLVPNLVPALAKFRPSMDDTLYDALKLVLNSKPVQHKASN